MFTKSRLPRKFTKQVIKYIFEEGFGYSMPMLLNMRRDVQRLLDLPVALRDPELGICGHIASSYRYPAALLFRMYNDPDTPPHSCNPSYFPIEKYGHDCKNNTMWVGERGKKRIELVFWLADALDEMIRVLRPRVLRWWQRWQLSLDIPYDIRNKIYHSALRLKQRGYPYHSSVGLCNNLESMHFNPYQELPKIFRYWKHPKRSKSNIFPLANIDIANNGGLWEGPSGAARMELLTFVIHALEETL